MSFFWDRIWYDKRPVGKRRAALIECDICFDAVPEACTHDGTCLRCLKHIIDQEAQEAAESNAQA